jgi:hypothetical protein
VRCDVHVVDGTAWIKTIWKLNRNINIEIKDLLVMRNIPKIWIPVGSNAINLSSLSSCNIIYKSSDELEQKTKESW